MSHPAQQAVDRLSDELHGILANKGVKPGDSLWFEAQAKGTALSMLRGMIQVGAHEDPVAAEAYRRSIHVKGLVNGEEALDG